MRRNSDSNTIVVIRIYAQPQDKSKYETSRIFTDVPRFSSHLFPTSYLFSQVKQLPDLRFRICNVLDRMPDRPWVREDLMIIPTHLRLITKKVNGSIFHPTRQLRFVFQMLQTIPLVPACGEDIERDLSTNRVSASQSAILADLISFESLLHPRHNQIAQYSR